MDQQIGFRESQVHDVLIVDDDQEMGKLLETLFQKNGYTAGVAQTGQEAVKYIQANRPDVVLLDKKILKNDGNETYIKIISQSNIPMLFFTSSTSMDCSANFVILVDNNNMHRPFQPEELITWIGTLHRDQVHAQPETPIADSKKPIHADLPLVSVVIPAYNEETGLPLVLKALFSALDHTYEILVVDDGSSDNTANVTKGFPCRLIRHPHNRGKGAALRTGLQHARGRSVIFLDADNTYPVKMIPILARELENYDLVRGVRSSGRTNIPTINRVGNYLFDTLIRILHKVEGGDLLSGMYGGRRDRLQELNLEADGFDIETEICVKSKALDFKCGTIPITYSQRVGEKKLSVFHDGLRIAYRSFQLAVSLSPLLIFIIPGLVLLFLSLIGIGLVQLKHLHQINLPLAVNGTFLLGVLAALGVQAMVLGLAVYTAGMAYGFRGRANRILDRIIHFLSTRTSFMIGTLLAFIGFMGIAWLTIDWFIQQGPFEQTTPLVILTFCIVFGVQMLSAGVFLSAFKGLGHLRIEQDSQKLGVLNLDLAESFE